MVVRYDRQGPPPGGGDHQPRPALHDAAAVAEQAFACFLASPESSYVSGATPEAPGGSYTAFSCPGCDALFGDWFLHSYMTEARMEDAEPVLIFPEGRDRLPAPHWCVDTGSGRCVDHLNYSS